MLNAGELDTRVRVQSVTENQDASGEPDPSWATLATRWMKVEPLRGRERFEAGQLDPEVDYRFTARHDSTISAVTPKHRLVLDNSTGRVFDIQAVLNVREMGDALEIMAKENV